MPSRTFARKDIVGDILLELLADRSKILRSGERLNRAVAGEQSGLLRSQADLVVDDLEDDSFSGLESVTRSNFLWYSNGSFFRENAL